MDKSYERGVVLVIRLKTTLKDVRDPFQRMKGVHSCRVQKRGRLYSYVFREYLCSSRLTKNHMLVVGPCICVGNSHVKYRLGIISGYRQQPRLLQPHPSKHPVLVQATARNRQHGAGHHSCPCPLRLHLHHSPWVYHGTAWVSLAQSHLRLEG